jgi:hypothetical protein
MMIGVECGQRWYRPSSWRRPIFQRIYLKRGGTGGFCIGPIMFHKGK